MKIKPKTIRTTDEIREDISSKCLLTLKLSKPIAIPNKTVLKAWARAEMIVMRNVCCLVQLNFFSKARIGIQWLGIKACKMLIVRVPVMSCEIKAYFNGRRRYGFNWI